jgi:hypothetical protein
MAAALTRPAIIHRIQVTDYAGRTGNPLRGNCKRSQMAGHHFRINKTLATRTNIICNKQDASSSHFLTAGTLKLYPIMSFAFLDGL